MGNLRPVAHKGLLDGGCRWTDTAGYLDPGQEHEVDQPAGPGPRDKGPRKGRPEPVLRVVAREHVKGEVDDKESVHPDDQCAARATTPEEPRQQERVDRYV